MLLHRIVSGILLVLIILPLYFILAVLNFVFNFCNQFHYNNFWKVEIPEWMSKDVMGTKYMKALETLAESTNPEPSTNPMIFDVSTRIAIIIFSCFVEFWKTIKEGWKSIKF